MMKGQYKIYSEEEIDKKRKFIHDTMIKKHGMKGNFDSLNSKNLEQLGELYDKVFFDGQVSRKNTKEGNTLKYEVTHGGKAKSAGWCSTSRTPKGYHCHFIIRIPAGLYFKLFTKGEKSLDANGMKCYDRLGCLQMVFEHEFVHMLMQLYNYENKITQGPGKQIYSAHGKLFQCITRAYFGHKSTRHGLLHGEAEGKATREELKKGTKVSFEYKGQKIYGEIFKLMPKNVKVLESTPYRGRIWTLFHAMLTIES